MTHDTTRWPTAFVGHGAPTLALDAARGEPLRVWGEQLGKPRAILAVSAHWERAPLTIGARTTVPLVYDFGGFPDALYRVQYASPGAPELAARVASLVPGAAQTERGLDHGVWTPLVHLFPAHDVPVLEVSMPSSVGAAGLFELGRALAPLRDEGVLILGSGNVTHNLRRVDWNEANPPEAWAAEFDAWAADALARRDFEALLDYRNRAPALRLNHPTEEHWLPLFVALGAASDATSVTFPVTGWEYGNLSRRAVQLG